MSGCVFPADWQPAAAEVREIHTRARLAAVLRNVETALGQRSLTEIADVLADTADMVRSAAELSEALAPPVAGDAA
jgi:hypothetical protein